eukprot:958262-Prymnesium_polylepis.1
MTTARLVSISTVRLSQIDVFALSTRTGSDQGPLAVGACTMYVWRGGGSASRRPGGAVVPRRRPPVQLYEPPAGCSRGDANAGQTYTRARV